MGEVHIYTAEKQSAVRFVDRVTGEDHWFENKPNKLLRCWTCMKKRQAKNLIVQVYYDSTRFFCGKLKGCNSPKAKSRWCTKHQVNHGPKTWYWSCREKKFRKRDSKTSLAKQE